MPPTPARGELAPALGASLLGLCWFVLSGGAAVLDPRHVGWLLRGGDGAVHWLGWAFFRGAGWSLPLGALPRYAEPLGTTVGFTDALPLLALLLRPLSTWLPADFQYLGPWLGLCFALQGFFGARLAAAAGAGRAGQLLGGALFATSPVLLRRVGHTALCSQWILVAPLATALRSYPGRRGGVKCPGSVRARGEGAGPLLCNGSRPADPDSSTGLEAARALTRAAALAALAASIHPTLAVMAFPLLAAAALGLAWQRLVSAKRVAATLLATAATDALLFLLLGYGSAPLAARGFAWFSSDLLALVNPMGWSRLFPSWPTRTPGQWEGYAWLGAGGLALGLLALVALLVGRVRPPWRRVGPTLAACLLFAAVALSSHVTLAGRKLFGTSDLPTRLAPILAPFRASGRFVWPLHLLLLAAGVAGTVRLFHARPRWAGAALAAALGLQVLDLGAGRLGERLAPGPVPSLAGWEAAGQGYRHLALLPPHLRDADGRGCGGPWGEREARLAYLAYRLRLGVNSAYLSRMDEGRALAACAAAVAEARAGRLRDDTVYLPDPALEPGLVAAGATCGRVAGELACVGRGGPEPFRSALASAPP